MAKRRKKSIRKSSKKGKSFKKGWFIGSVILVACLGIVLFFYLQKETKIMRLHSFRKNVPEGFASIGIDVSHHQGKIDWEKLFLKSGFDSIISFVYCKATEGYSHFDREYKRNRKQLNELGVPNSAYHFFSPKEDPVLQAKHFLSVWKKRDIDLPPMLDVESEGNSDKELIENMTVWLAHVEQESGFRPIIYTSLHYYETKFQQHFANYRFWIAAYSRKPPCIEDDRIIHWQYTEKGELPCIKEKVDINVSKISY